MLLGLHGVSRSGKDTVASILVQRYGFQQRALADGIRKILLDLNPWLRDNEGDLVQLRWLYEEALGDWDVVKSRSKDSVDFMIRLGQAARDNVSENVWIQSAFPTLSYDPKVDGHIVISDCRQPNEVDFLYKWGGELWLVERPEATEERGMDGLLKGQTFDARVLNDGTIEDLEYTVGWIMAQDQM